MDDQIWSSIYRLIKSLFLLKIFQSSSDWKTSLSAIFLLLQNNSKLMLSFFLSSLNLTVLKNYKIYFPKVSFSPKKMLSIQKSKQEQHL